MLPLGGSRGEIFELFMGAEDLSRIKSPPPPPPAAQAKEELIQLKSSAPLTLIAPAGVQKLYTFF